MIKRVITALILLSLCSNAVFASSWVRKKGNLFLAPSFNYYQASQYYDKRGHKRPIGCTFKKWETSLYGEYGLTNDTTLTFKLPFADLKCGSSTTAGLEDIAAGFVRNIRKTSESSFSYYGNLIVPTGYSIKDNPRLGYGKFGLEGGLLYGTSGNWGFMDSGLGYRYYFGYPSSQLRSYLTGGLNITNRIQLFGILDGQIGLGDGRVKKIGKNVFLEPNYKLVQLYIGPRLMLKNGISLVTGYQRVLWGRNTGVGSGFFVSLWLPF